MIGFPDIPVDQSSDAPVYRQIADAVAAAIGNGRLQRGEKLPATRELAGRLGMNRATISAAYALLEESGLIEGHVGRGSFVSEATGQPGRSRPNDSGSAAINFASSRPASDAFPLASFRRISRSVIESNEAGDILQLGSPYGYGPLRRYLLESLRTAGIARAGDDLLITSGCQQALDLIARTLASNGTPVVCEDPVYHGLLRVLERVGCRVIPVRVGPCGLDLDALAAVLSTQKVRLIVLTPSYQNPTGATMPFENRERLVQMAQGAGVVIVESDIYSELRYSGESLPTLKRLDETGRSLLLGSYSKISFPGLRVGWVVGPKETIARLAEEKQISDLHSDQLSQAVLLSFAQSGELARHLERTRAAGRERLAAALESCQAYLPEGSTWTSPEGGMCLWITLPALLSAEALLPRVRRLGVDFLPGRQFSSGDAYPDCLRISFGGLSPDQIRRGLRILGEAAREELSASLDTSDFERAMALV